jgi:DNA-binding NarL/FixJ family response regulator
MSVSPQIWVLSVDDHPLLHEGLSTVIRNQPDMLLVAEASNGHDAIPAFSRTKTGRNTHGFASADMSGIDAMLAIRSEFPEARIIILTTFAGDVEIQRALASGARAYMLKSMPPQGTCRSHSASACR